VIEYGPCRPPVRDRRAALESLIKWLNARSIKVIMAGVQPRPLRVLARAGWRNRRGQLRIFRSFERAVELARHHAPGAAR